MLAFPIADFPFLGFLKWMAQMNSGLEAARMDTMKGYSSGLQVESEGDVRSWLSICSEECAGFTPEYEPVLCKGVFAGPTRDRSAVRVVREATRL